MLFSICSPKLNSVRCHSMSWMIAGLLALPALTACGGGGGGSTTATPPVVVAPPSTPPTTPPPMNPPALPSVLLPSFNPLPALPAFEREFVLNLAAGAAATSLHQSLSALYQQGLEQAELTLGCQVNVPSCRQRFVLKLQLPAGVYQLDAALNFRHNVVLIGDPAGTKLQIRSATDQDYGIRFAVFNRAEPVDLSPTSELTKGSRQLELDFSAYKDGVSIARLQQAGITTVQDDAPPFGVLSVNELRNRYQVGAMIQLESDPQTTVPASQDLSRAWLTGQHRRWTYGELNRITAVRATSDPLRWIVEVEQPLMQTYQAAQSRVRVVDMLEHAGVSQLSIERLPALTASSDSRQAVGDNLWFYHVRHVHIHGLNSQLTYGAHVNLQMVYGCHIRQNQFRESRNYGVGGAGYGIDLNRHTRGCLIEDNTFQNLRHGIVSHYGAGGQVIAYNTFSDSKQVNSNGEQRPASDLLLHGDNAAGSLLEGNLLDSLVFDDVWGRNGPDHVVLRNCIRRELRIAASSPGQFVLGNLVLGQEPSLDWQAPPLATAHGNWVAASNQVQWLSGFARQLPSSGYLSQTPDYARGWQLPKYEPTRVENCVL